MADMGGRKKRDWDLLHKFELDLMRKERPDLARNLRIVDAMYDEARQLGIFPLKDPLEGLETDLRIARVINLVRENPHQDS